MLDVEDRVVYDSAVASTGAVLKEQDFEQERQAGRAMSIEEALTYALQPLSGTLLQ